MSEEKKIAKCKYCGFPVYGKPRESHPECEEMAKNLDLLAEDIVKGILPHHRALCRYLAVEGEWKGRGDVLKCILMAKVDEMYFRLCHLVTESSFSPKWEPKKFLPAVEKFLFWEGE
jgi:hypothetical protein